MSQLKKLEREQKFNLDEFNKKFEEADSITDESDNIKQNKQLVKQNDQLIKHKQQKLENLSYTEDLGINMKNLFFEILEMLINIKNPIPYIMENEKRQFSFAVMILIIGGLLLFWSNLMYQ